MAEGPSGEYRSLSERLEAEKFRAGSWTDIDGSELAWVTDINDLFPEVMPPVGVRVDSWNNVYLRGVVVVDCDTAEAAEAIDWSGVSSQPGTIPLFHVPEAVRPELQQGFASSVAYQKGAHTVNLGAFLTIGPDGSVKVAIGGYTQDPEVSMQSYVAGATLTIMLSGSYSLN